MIDEHQDRLSGIDYYSDGRKSKPKNFFNGWKTVKVDMAEHEKAMRNLAKLKGKG
jgi:hypothetical protein